MENMLLKNGDSLKIETSFIFLSEVCFIFQILFHLLNDLYAGVDFSANILYHETVAKHQGFQTTHL